MKRFIVPFFMCSLLLFGFGCRKAGTVQTPATSSEPEVFFPTPPPEETENQRNLRELREALEAFQNVKTFRAKLSADGKDGLTTGQIDIVKPDRFHGTIQVPQETQTSEVIGVSDTLYIRLADGNWTYVKTPAVSKALTDAFRSAVDGDRSMIRSAIPDVATVSKQPDSAHGCDRYRTQITSNDGTTVDLYVCVQGGLPKLIELQLSQGRISVEYFDYNKLFVIERPTVNIQ